MVLEDETDDAKGVDVAAGKEPETNTPTGPPFRGVAPSAAVSHGGSFGREESNTPRSTSSRSGGSISGRSNRSCSGAGGNSSSSSGSSPSNRDTNSSSRGSGDDDGGRDNDGEDNLAVYAPLPPELPKGEASRLQSWGRHGDVITSSRLRFVRNRLEVATEELGAEGEAALLVQARALLVDILNDELQNEELQEAEELLNGHGYDDLLDSLATSPTEYHAHESASNVLSLMTQLNRSPTRSPWPSRKFQGSLNCLK